MVQNMVAENGKGLKMWQNETRPPEACFYALQRRDNGACTGLWAESERVRAETGSPGNGRMFPHGLQKQTKSRERDTA